VAQVPLQQAAMGAADEEPCGMGNDEIGFVAFADRRSARATQVCHSHGKCWKST